MTWAAHLAPMIVSMKGETIPPPATNFSWDLSPTEVLKTIQVAAPNVLNVDFQQARRRRSVEGPFWPQSHTFLCLPVVI